MGNLPGYSRDYTNCRMKEKGSLKPILVYSLSAIIILLVAITTGLYQSRKGYKDQNRELILRNDSIMAANIVLTNAVRSLTSELKPSAGRDTKTGKGQ